MSSSSTFSGNSIPLARPSDIAVVFLYTPSDDESVAGQYELLPNIRCLGISLREGSDPGSARFRYAFDDPLNDPDDPQRIEDCYPLDAQGPHVVENDDRLVVRVFRADGSSRLAFDCFAQMPQADLGPNTENVSFIGVGVPVREWDNPLIGACIRDGVKPLTGSFVQTDLPVRFNPDGKPNATPLETDDETGEEEGDAGTEPGTYPVFLGPVWPSNEINGETIRAWDLDMAVRYCVVRGTTLNTNGDLSTYVTWDDLTYIKPVLQAISPPDTNDDGVIDEDDDEIEFSDITVQDVDVTGMAWPAAVWRLIEPHGFGFRFKLTEGEAIGDAPWGDPEWTFTVYRKDFDMDGKQLHLQEVGGQLDPGQTNLQSLTLARDTHGIANQIAIDAHLIRVECAFILAPLFQVAAADAAAAALKNFVESSSANWPTFKNLYRLYGFDECAEGHWDFKTSTWITDTPGDLTKAFTIGAKNTTKVKFANRRRPAISDHKLISVDEDTEEPLKYALLVSMDYKGKSPGIYDGSTATWQKITNGGWELWDDGLGIRITTPDPNSWPIGDPKGGPQIAGLAGNKLCVVEYSAAPTGNFKPPVFMLVCCVDYDQDFEVNSPKRAASPTKFTITRRVDCRERYHKTCVSKFSWYADIQDFLNDDAIATDDTDDAQALADAERRASESGVFAGTAVIPRFTKAYHIGNLITAIDGRDVSLRTNAGAEQSEAPVYPSVVALHWEFDDGVSTSLELTDDRGEPPPRKGKRLKKRR